MHSFHYRDGRLHCEGVDLGTLADTHGTPLYVYSAGTILDHYRRLDAAFAELNHLVCYSVKANSNLAVLDLLARAGAGFDVVSGGELFRVQRAGGDPGRCMFAGVGKTREEIAGALRAGIYSFNVESEAELERINAVAGKLGLRAPVAVRVNPEVSAGGHRYISTGKSENKFGVAFDRVAALYAEAAHRLPHVWLRGVGLGIVYRASLESGDAAWWQQEEEKGGEQSASSSLTVEAYAEALVPLLRPLGLRVLLEPGRLIVGNAGVLLTRVQYRKTTASGKRFVIVDAGMNDLIRPALYEGYHEVVPVVQPDPAAGRETVDVVGPVCESGDFFAQSREVPPVGENGLIALMSAGAYGAAMGSNYNTRPLPAEILVRGDRADVVRERQTLDDLVRDERVPGST